MTVQYQGVWSLQSAAQLQSTQRWVTDPLFDYTTLLLQADDAANGAQNNTFLDSSSNSFAITRNGNTTQGSFTPFSLQPGAWGNFFDGSSKLNIGSSTPETVLQLASSDFTVEAWVYTTSSSAAWQYVISNLNNGVGNLSWAVRFYGSTGVISFLWGTTSSFTGNVEFTSSAGAVVPNTWTNITVTRSGSTFRIYANGVQVGTGTNATAIFSQTQQFTIGSTIDNADRMNGYISNLRITKGGVLYTANFTPSTTPLTTTVSAGSVSALTCQSNRFVDNSSNALAITVGGGTPSVQAFSPFAPQFQWTPSVIGGSGYFDGTGDFLQTPSNAALGMSTGDFTIECWYYQTSRALTNTIIAPSTDNLNIYINTSGILGFYDGSARNSTTTVPLNTWNHIALVRSGSTATLYFNGVSVVSQANTINYATASWYVGRNSGGTDQCTGYCASARILKGTALYTGTFAPPTVPLTAITNTQLLLNFTNAGIYDGTMKNNLETVGNASVSTAVVKYGSGSLAFDGSGDYLSCPAANAGMNPQTGDFTIECWVWIPALPGAEQALVSTITTGGSGVLLGLAGGGNVNRIQFGIGNLSVSNPTVVDSSTFPVRTWTHVAAVRRAGILYLYKDGVSIGTPTAAAGSISQATLTVGAWSTGSAAFNGYLDDVRITAGIARYTQNFIPPSVALPRQ